ncbi:ExbD/TolR family protein [Altibacter lentus]|uniref:ExbD/TolR family protein n=1 Tax=Altibacter lentus TaxID=1223410 RepID=UPI0005535F3F|nr:biopolymer transporter ExbD [Altibacter lentus]
MRSSNKTPAINAGSTADIAFLLLIFFLVTTTLSNDKGIVRGLPEPCPVGADCTTEHIERNVFRIVVGAEGDLLVNREIMPLSDLQHHIKEFVQNNGDGSCLYCFGKGSNASSDNPKEAVLSLTTHRKAPYSVFIAVQDEITAAYSELRSMYALRTFQKESGTLSEAEMEKTKNAFPFKLVEATFETRE